MAVYVLAQVLGWSEIAGGLVVWGALVVFVTRRLIVDALRRWFWSPLTDRLIRFWMLCRALPRWLSRAGASNG